MKQRRIEISLFFSKIYKKIKKSLKMFTKLALHDTTGFDQCFLALGKQLAFQGTDEPRECAQDL